MEPTDQPLDADASRGFVLERRWLSADAGSLRRLTYTNVPHGAASLSPGYDWGNHSPGAYRLALDILEEALARTGHGGPRASVPGGRPFLAALLLHGRFVTEVISGLPDDGGVIPAEEVATWVREALTTVDPGLLAPRYEVFALPASGAWSADEAGAILGVPVQEQGDVLAGPDGQPLAHRLVTHPLDTSVWMVPPL